MGSPHSGQVGSECKSSISELLSLYQSSYHNVGISSSVNSSVSNNLLLFFSHKSSIAYPIADGHDVPIDVSPFWIFLALYDGHECTFLSCLIISLTSIPPRKHNEINLEIARACFCADTETMLGYEESLG